MSAPTWQGKPANIRFSPGYEGGVEAKQVAQQQVETQKQVLAQREGGPFLLLTCVRSVARQAKRKGVKNKRKFQNW